MVNQHISADLKECALCLWELGWEELDILQGLAVSCSSIYHWRKLFDDIRSVTRPPSPLCGQTRIITCAVLTAVHEIYKGDPDIYLDELVFWLAIHHDIVISKPSLHRNLEEAGLTCKLLYKIAREHDEQVWQEYWDVVNGELEGNNDLLVFADEISKNDHTLAHQYGRAAVGKQVAFTDVFVREQCYSLAVALSKGGYIATKAVPGLFDSFDFFEFVSEQVIPQMQAFPDEQSVLIINNCHIHHNDALLELVNGAGCLLLYLPPYSPNLNPIEESFSTLKAYMCQHGGEMRAAEDPVQSLLEACGAVTAEMACAWFIHSGY